VVADDGPSVISHARIQAACSVGLTQTLRLLTTPVEFVVQGGVSIRDVSAPRGVDKPDEYAVECYVGISYLADNNLTKAKTALENVVRNDRGLY